MNDDNTPPKETSDQTAIGKGLDGAACSACGFDGLSVDAARLIKRWHKLIPKEVDAIMRDFAKGLFSELQVIHKINHYIINRLASDQLNSR